MIISFVVAVLVELYFVKVILEAAGVVEDVGAAEGVGDDGGGDGFCVVGVVGCRVAVAVKDD